MPSSVLTQNEKALPGSLDNVNEKVAKNPYAGTLLEHLSDDMRQEILGSLEADRNPEEDADKVGTPGVPTPPGKINFDMNAYSIEMQYEIRASLHLDTIDELDASDGGVGYPLVLSVEEMAARAAEYDAKVKSNMQRLGRRTNVQTA